MNVPPLVITIGWPASVILAVAGVVAYLIKNPEKLDHWASIIARCVAWFSSRAERAAVARDVQAEVNSFQKSVDSEVPGVLPNQLRIEWVSREETREAFLKNNEIVVRLRHHRDRDRNMVTTILLYVSKGVLPRARAYLGAHLRRAVDFTMVRKILAGSKQHTAVSYFFQEVADPEMEEKPELKTYCITMQKLDDMGYFTRILLRELHDLGLKMHLKMPDQDVYEDAGELVSFLDRLSSRKPGEEIPLDFVGRRTRVGMLLIAKPETFAYRGFRPYERRIAKIIDLGCSSIYICGRGANIGIVQELVSRYRDSEIVKMLPAKRYRVHLPGRKAMPAICVPCRVVKETTEEVQDIPVEPVRETGQ